MTRGERIKKARTDAGFGLTELAEKIKVSKQTLYKYENDIITNIPSDKILDIADICSVTPSYLMGWEDDDRLLELAKIARFNRELEVFTNRMNDFQRQQLLQYARFLLSDNTDKSTT